jgi:hypothetical protein
MKKYEREIVTIKDEEEIDTYVNKIIRKKNYNGYEIGPLHTRYENDKIVHGHMVYFYDNEGNVVDVINFKFK